MASLTTPMREVQNSPPSGPQAGSPPHAPLVAYYGAAQARDGFVRNIFDRTAASYDRINAIASFGSGGWYRRRALLGAGLRPGHRLLDVAIGTGLVAREAIRILGNSRDVIGLDLSRGMLIEARRRLGAEVGLICARAEALPLPDASVDFVTMGYALRHVADLAATFAEYRRVLRPGGRLLVLEISRPKGRLAYRSTRFYLGQIVPAVSRLMGGAEAATLMRYYWDTIDGCVPPEAIAAAIAAAGFAAQGCEVQLGVFRAYAAQR